MVPVDCFLDSEKCLTCRSPQMTHRHPQLTACQTHTSTTLKPASCACSLRKQREQALVDIEHRQKAGQSLQDEEKPQAWAVVLPAGERNRNYQQLVWWFVGSKKTSKLKNSAIRGSKKWKTSEQRKPQNL